jgi:hypothetical protein
VSTPAFIAALAAIVAVAWVIRRSRHRLRILFGLIGALVVALAAAGAGHDAGAYGALVLTPLVIFVAPGAGD